jgi:hypothetical protein|tara:strand:+ start:2130 stop:2258 length:129 start_codon:yes stop_codon:yes gene_type:complete
MNIAFSQRRIHFQENQNMALFLKKINRRFFFNQMLSNFKMEL